MTASGSACARPQPLCDALIVEDDLLIALDLEETMLKLGASSVRTASTAAQALAMIEHRAPHVALLNIDLGDETSFAVAERLDALDVCFGFVTGYGDDGRLPLKFAGRPRLGKPFEADEIAAVMAMIPGFRPRS